MNFTKTHGLHHCGLWLQMHHVRFSQQNRICTYKWSSGGGNMHVSFYVSIWLFSICSESSFHPFHREVTRKALFTEKPQHQSLPSLSAPRKKPNFSCCNWLKACHSHFWLEENARLEREYDRTVAKYSDIVSAATGTNHPFQYLKQLKLMDYELTLIHVYINIMFHPKLRPFLSTCSTF